MEEKKALKKQFADMLKGHISAVAAEGLLELFVLGFLFVIDGVRIIAGILFMLIYGALIYYRGKKAAQADMKSYSVLKPSLKRGALLGVSIAAASLILFAADKVVWLCFSDGGVLTNAFAKTVNAVFVIWNVPYYGFLGDGAGVVTPLVFVLMLVVPIISSLLGYFAGIKGINIFEKFNASMYEKK